MKNKFTISIALVIVLITIQACSAGSGAQPTKTIQEATLAEAQSTPSVASIPTQQTSGVDNNAGPETIDLTSPTLYITTIAPAYTLDVLMNFSGMASNGTTKEVTLAETELTQTLPQKEHHFLVVVTGGEGSAESVFIGDQGYSVFLGTCFLFSASSSEGQNAAAGMPKLQELITGQAQRVDTGVEVNGFVTDKYELTSENMNDKDELSSAFVYVARDGGFITLYEAQTRTKTDYQGFDPNQLTDVSITFNFIPVEDGSLVITIPTVCAN